MGDTLEVLAIGPVRAVPPIVAAPIAGYTDSPFRVLCRRLGAGMVFTELISAYGLIYANRKTLKMLQFDEAERPLGIQIFGADPSVCADAARIVAAHGPDVIDINMGCSVPKVAKTGSGAALLGDLRLAGKIIQAVVDAVDIPVTVKTRLGLGAGDESGLELARVAEASGASAVIMHGRHARQGLAQEADWGFVRRVGEAVSIPVIGNGDVQSTEQAKDLMRKGFCSGVMIGRAALANPALFSGDHSPEGRMRAALEHIRLVRGSDETERSPAMAAKRIRKHLLWYVRELFGARHLRRAITQITDLSEAEGLFFSLMKGAEDHGERNLA